MTSIQPSPRDGRMRMAEGFSRHSSIETTCSMSPGSIRVHSTRAMPPFSRTRDEGAALAGVTVSQFSLRRSVGDFTLSDECSVRLGAHSRRSALLLRCDGSLRYATISGRSVLPFPVARVAAVGLGLVGRSPHSVGALELMLPGQPGAERGAARAAPVCVSSA
jgi:hypothetical protein